MASSNQLMMVAVNCPGYEATESNVINSIGASNCKSCDNCNNWVNHNCSINLYDEVLTSIDQT